MFGLPKRRPEPSIQLDWDAIDARMVDLQGLGPSIVARLDQTGPWLRDCVDALGVDRTSGAEVRAFLIGVALLDKMLTTGRVGSVAEMQVVTTAMMGVAMGWAKKTGVAR